MKVELGQKVSFSTTLTRKKSFTRRYWTTVPTEPTDGIVVGARTLSDGYIDYCDEGRFFLGDEYFKAYLVAFDLRRAPVYVKETDLILLEDPTKVFEPTLPGL